MQNCLLPPLPGYSRFDVVAMASSLGGPQALSQVLPALPPDFPAAIVLVQHVSAITGPAIHQQLGRISPISVVTAEDGQPVRPGHLYMAKPDYHLLVSAERRFSLTHTPRVKFCRPAADPLFASVAGAYRDRALGVVLTGCNTDGAIGVQTIKWMGGRVLAQDPATSRASGMPRAAIATGMVDYVLPLEMIAPALVALVMAPGVAEYLRVVPAAA